MIIIVEFFLKLAARNRNDFDHEHETRSRLDITLHERQLDAE